MRQVNLVDDQDKIIGHMDLLEAHRGKGKKHQAISFFLFHKKGDDGFELLLQQRSAQKIVGAMEWANTLCANLLPNESHLQCLERRLVEELGIEWKSNWKPEKAIVFSYEVACENGFSENEIDHFFTLVLNDEDFANLKISPNQNEVADFDWFDWSLVKVKRVGEKRLTPWFNLFLDNQEVINKIETSCQKQAQ